MTKRFVPDTIAPLGTSSLAITIGNPAPAAVSGVNFQDLFPSGLTVANTPNASTSGCGSPTFGPAPGDTSLTFTGGIIAPNSSCVIKVDVTAGSAGSYLNTTGLLYIGGTTVNTGINTGKTATDTLVVATTPSCTPGTKMADWLMISNVNNPPNPTFKASNVATATLAANVSGSTQFGSPGVGGTGYYWESYGYGGAGQFIEFTINTTNYSNVSMDYYVANPSEANGPTSIQVWYDKGAGYVQLNSATVTNPATGFTSHTVDLSSLTNTLGNTKIKLLALGAKNDQSGASLRYDDIVFTGCSSTSLAPVPTLTKAFSPSTIAADGATTSTLTFTIANTQTGNVALTGVSFLDDLPAGIEVAPTPSDATSGAGCTSVIFAPLAGDQSLSYTAGNMTAGATCTASVKVVATQAGVFDNVTGYIRSNESGENTTSSGYGRATLTAILPPTIHKAFADAQILTASTTTLSFSITNPNPATSVTGIAFTDTLPAGIDVASGSSSQ